MGRLRWREADWYGNFWQDHAAEIWWPGGKIANRNLEAVQEKVGKRLLGASRSVPGAAVRGDLGWRKLEERREGKKLMMERG